MVGLQKSPRWTWLPRNARLTTSSRSSRLSVPHFTMITSHEYITLWTRPRQDTVAYLALLSLALRQSSPFAVGLKAVYARLRDCFFRQMDSAAQKASLAAWGSACRNLLGPALLRTDTLQCLSRLLAEGAEQLKPAAALALNQQLAEAGGRRDERQLLAPGSLAEAQHDLKPQTPSLAITELPLRSLMAVLAVFCAGLTRPGLAAARSTTSTTTSPSAPSFTLQTVRAQLSSSGVLERWAQVLLLGPPAAPASGRARGALHPEVGISLQVQLFCGIVKLLSMLEGVQDFLRGPCGGALAATYMAHLCAALDGDTAFGLAKPNTLVLPALDQSDGKYLVRSEGRAATLDASAAEERRVASLHAALAVLGAWLGTLVDSFQGGPGGVEASKPFPGEVEAEAQRGAAGAGAGAGMGPDGAGEAKASGAESGSGAECAGQGRPGPRTAVASNRGLLPADRSATFQKCLRLAKGVLACWGQPLTRVRLDISLGSAAAALPVLPLCTGAAVVQCGLACARLALLPAVWGRSRVGERKRAQLRAWWEVFLASARHPEALLAGCTELPKLPGWTYDNPDLPAQLSADAAEALEAGLLPCLTRLVIRMGAGRQSGPVWCRPNSYPGVAVCCRELLLLGPVDQAAAVVAALGMRLRGAVVEQGGAITAMAAVAAGPTAGLCAVQSMRWQADVLREAMSYSRDLIILLVAQVLCPEPPLVNVGVAWEVQTGGTDAAGDGAAAGGGGATAAAVDGARLQHIALRASYAVAELLPPMSQALLLCAVLARSARVLGASGGQGEGYAWRELGGSAAEELQQLVDYSHVCAMTAMRCHMVLVAKMHDAMRKAAQPHSTGAGEGDDGKAEAQVAAAASPWKHLLLHEVQLMEVLAAGIELHQAAAETPIMMNHPGVTRPVDDQLRRVLKAALDLAAVAFPAEFRAAVVGGSGATAAGAPEASPAPGSCAAAAAAAAAAVPATPEASAKCPPPCIPLCAMQSLLGREGTGMIQRVLGGWEPS